MKVYITCPIDEVGFSARIETRAGGIDLTHAGCRNSLRRTPIALRIAAEASESEVKQGLTIAVYKQFGAAENTGSTTKVISEEDFTHSG